MAEIPPLPPGVVLDEPDTGGGLPPLPPGVVLDSAPAPTPKPNPRFPATDAANRALAATSPVTKTGTDMYPGAADIRLKPPAAPKIPVETVPLTPAEQLARDAWNLPGRAAKSVVKTAQDIYRGQPTPPVQSQRPFSAPPVTTGPGAVTIPEIAQGQPGITQRAYRNNNPGNLEFAKQPGATPDKEGGRFASFSTPEAGYQALIDRVKIASPNQTLAKYISVFAPPNENNTGEYLKFVASRLGVDPNARMADMDANKLAAAQAFKESQTIISGAPAGATAPVGGYKKGASESRIGHHLETTPVNVIPELAKLAASATGIPGILGIPDAIKDWASGTPNRGYPPGPIGENPLSQAVGNLSMAGALSSNAPAPSASTPRNMGEAFGAPLKHEVTIEPWRTGEKPPPSGFLSRLTAPGTGRMWGGATEMAGGVGLAMSGHPIAGPSLFIRGVRDFHKGLDTPRTAPTPRPQVREFTTVDRGAPRWAGMEQPEYVPPPLVEGTPGVAGRTGRLASGRRPGPATPPPDPDPRPAPLWAGMEQPTYTPPPEVIGIPGALASGRVPGVVTPKPISLPRAAAPWLSMEQPAYAPPAAVEPIPGALASGRTPGPRYGPEGPPPAPVSSRPAPPWQGMEQPTVQAPPVVEGIPGPLASGRVPGKPPAESVPVAEEAPVAEVATEPVVTTDPVAEAAPVDRATIIREASEALAKALRKPKKRAARAKSVEELIRDFKKGPTPEAKGGVTLPHGPHGPIQPHGFPGPKGPKGPSSKTGASGRPNKNTGKPKRRWYSPPRMPKLKPEPEMPRMPR